MIRDQFTLDLNRELIIDNFAGGGGASTGIELALGRHVDIAINHDPEAVALHSINHPQTEHYCESVWDVDPREVTKGRPIGLIWFSPDCKHFSKAKGGKPRNKRIRGLAWVTLRWASLPYPSKPRVIFLENVEEFRTWGPLLTDGKPCPKKKGRTFNSFLNALARHGYTVEHRELRGMDYGAPTIRKRLFLIARSDGQAIVWPAPTHGDPESADVKAGKLKPWPTAGNDVIDWSIPCPSIFERTRPLAENTLRRIARGINRYVLNTAKPFIVKVNHGYDYFRGQAIDDPMQTVTATHGYGLVAPVMTECANASSQRCMPADEPLRTVCAEVKGGHHALIGATLVGAGGPTYQGKPRGADQPMATLTTESHHAVAAATLIKHYGGNYKGAGVDLSGPMHTATTVDHHALVAAHITKFRSGSTGFGADEPLHTVTAGPKENPAGAPHAMGVVAAHLVRQFGNSDAAPADAPVGTVTAGGGGKTQLVAANLLKLYGTSQDGQAASQPMPTVTAGGNHIAEVRAFLVKYYGDATQGQSLRDSLHTVTTKDRIGLVTVSGVDYQIADIGMRMLEPRELYAAQGFPKSYVIDPVINGRRLPKHAQVRMAGNSVCPPLAEALVRANCADMMAWSGAELKQRGRAAA
ncbi:DNA cytosine methyltransferase [Chromobacterium sp. CV08]|uniref:DNA cytosine methyltransferase n=1 Tax=Chromobacterium sp. CV08 TaxID=3133274 RepID=UPI003DA9357F